MAPVKNRLRKYKHLNNIELLEKYNIGGIWLDYLQRSFCKCGYCSNEHIYVCPECGEQNFIEGNYSSIKEQDDTKISFSGKAIVKTKTFLNIKYSKDEAFLDLAEEEKELFRLEETEISPSSGRYYYNGYREDYTDEESLEIRELIKKNKRKFSSEFISALILAEELNCDRPEKKANHWKKFMKAGCINAHTAIRNYKDTNKQLLITMLDKANENGLSDVLTISEFVKDLSIPKVLQEHLTPKVLQEYKERRYYYSRSNDDVDKLYSKMPEIMKNVMVHYYLNNLIDNDTFSKAPACSTKLFEENPDLALNQLKKYFANFNGGRRRYGYGYYSSNTASTMDEVVEYYENEGIPIEEGTFDFRNFNAMKNNKIIVEQGWEELKVSVETASMETNPVQALINIASTRRKRKKEED